MAAGHHQTPNDDDRAQRNRAMLTGCLLAGGDAGTYVLQIASPSEMPGTTVSSSPSSMPDKSAQTYKIVADNTQDLAQHLNKRVTINGHLEDNAGNTPVGTSGAASAQNGSIPASQLPSLRAESVHEVAGECHDTPVGSSNDRR
jgi:hypothetical protein